VIFTIVSQAIFWLLIKDVQVISMYSLPLKLPAQLLFQSTQITPVFTQSGHTKAFAFPFNQYFATIAILF
jgi:hypothetical protein